MLSKSQVPKAAIYMVGKNRIDSFLSFKMNIFFLHPNSFYSLHDNKALKIATDVFFVKKAFIVLLCLVLVEELKTTRA